MSPRPRSITDTDIITAAANFVITNGPQHCRLSDVAAMTRLAPATLLQRFGSREAMLENVAAVFISDIAAALGANEGPYLPALEAGLIRLPVHRHLAFFADRPDKAARYSLELRKHVAFSLAAAIENGEIAPCDVAATARQLQLAYYGHAAAALLEQRAVSPEETRKLIQAALGTLGASW